MTAVTRELAVIVLATCRSWVNRDRTSLGAGASDFNDSGRWRNRAASRFSRGSRFWSIHPVPTTAILVSLVIECRLGPWQRKLGAESGSVAMCQQLPSYR
jgi:hypothetical protein